MTNRDKMIDDIILAFDWEMGCIDSHNIMVESAAGDAPDLTDAYNRQKRKGKEYDEQRAALRRVLRRFLPEDTTPPDTNTMEKQLQPAAEKAVGKALAEAVKNVNK